MIAEKARSKNSSTYLKRRILWKAFNRIRSRFVSRAEKEWRKALEKYLTEEKNINIIRDVLRNTHVEVGGWFARRELAKLKGTKAWGDINDELGQRIAEGVDVMLNEVALSIAKTADKKYAAILLNESISEAEKLRLIDELIVSRSKMIAINEVLSASNTGQQTAIDFYEQSNPGFAVYKTWIATIDDRVRDAHEAADGQTVRNNEYFDVGGEALNRPRDPNGSPDNIVWCRCVMDTFKQRI